MVAIPTISDGDAMVDAGGTPAAVAGDPAMTSPPGASASPEGPGAPPPVTTRSGGQGAATPPTTARPLPPPEDLGAAVDPGPTKPPRPGVYRYRAQTDGQENEATTTVEHKGTTEAGTSQVISQRGGEIDTSSDVIWRNDGLVLLRSSFSFGQTTGECDWDPDFLQLKLPLSKGVAWQAISSCMVTGFGPSPLALKRTLDARVVDLRRVRIAGRAVDVWVLESTDHIEIAGRVMRQSGTTLLSARHGIIVSSSGTATTDGRSNQYATEVKNLDPE